jgi:hypothetical protein
MAWRAGASPAGFPLTGDQMETMSFAYIHNVATGLQRALWNCSQAPRPNPGECMRQRVPGAPAAKPTAPPRLVVPELAGVRRKERFETVKIAPVPVAAPSAPAKP